jgi:flagellar biosynthesis protein FlhF
LSDLRQILKSFSSTGIDRIIVSKTDETEAIGGVISIANEANLPISYVTTGQSVPDDIQVAEASMLTRMLIQELKG